MRGEARRGKAARPLPRCGKKKKELKYIFRSAAFHSWFGTDRAVTCSRLGVHYCAYFSTHIHAYTYRTKEARSELRSLVISADEVGCSSVRKRAGMAMAARRGPVGSRGGSREMAMERDPVGQVR